MPTLNTTSELVITTQLLRKIWNCIETTPQGYELCDAWLVDGPENVTSICVERHESGRDLAKFIWLEKLSPADSIRKLGFSLEATKYSFLTSDGPCSVIFTPVAGDIYKVTCSLYGLATREEAYQGNPNPEAGAFILDKLLNEWMTSGYQPE